ncbi:MAG: DUF5131 family protein [Kiritimatiellae bacterium]|nr:DUF5131 family protein [Kiritimatiellia bacterium]
MSDLIQWPMARYWDKPWNPWLGCRPVSPACDNCYARRATVERFGQCFEPHRTKRYNNPPTKGVVFCGNMTDLFGEWVSNNELSNIIGATSLTAVNLFLTKRTERLEIASHWDDRYGSRWFGMTAENQEWYDRRIDGFRASAFSHGWLSAEPLLGPIDLGLGYIAPEDIPFGWVAVGCESGPERRPCKLEWVESIVRQCGDARIPVFVKQLDIGGKCELDIKNFPKHLQIRQVPWAKKGEVK